MEDNNALHEDEEQFFDLFAPVRKKMRGMAIYARKEMMRPALYQREAQNAAVEHLHNHLLQVHLQPGSWTRPLRIAQIPSVRPQLVVVFPLPSFLCNQLSGLNQILLTSEVKLQTNQKW